MKVRCGRLGGKDGTEGWSGADDEEAFFTSVGAIGIWSRSKYFRLETKISGDLGRDDAGCKASGVADVARHICKY
jgi:hypothetical protein